MRRPLLLLPALLGVAACGAGTVAEDEVTTRAEEVLEAETGGVRPEVRCPGDLPAEAGAEMRCTATVAGEPDEYAVTVTVTSVEDDEARFDVVVDDQPLG